MVITNVGPNCQDICDVVYYEMCGQCSKEYECHKSIDHCTPIIDHEKMLDCVLKKLIIKSEDEIEDSKLINEIIEQYKNLDFVKDVSVNKYKCVSISVHVNDWTDSEKSKIIYGMYYKFSKLLKSGISIDVDINSGD